MEINEKKESQILTKKRGLSLAKKGIDISQTGLTKISKDVNSLNIHGEEGEQEETVGKSVSPMPFLSKRERRKWEKLSPSRKERILKQGGAAVKYGMDFKSAEGELRLENGTVHPQAGKPSVGGGLVGPDKKRVSTAFSKSPEGSFQNGRKQSSCNSVDQGPVTYSKEKGLSSERGRTGLHDNANSIMSGGSVNAGSSTAAGTATATKSAAGAAAGTTAGAAGAATGGVTVAAGAAKKTADKFRESLQRMSIQRAESIHEMQEHGKALMDSNRDMHGLQSVGKYMLGAASVVGAPILLALNAAVFSLLSAMAALLMPVILLIVVVSIVAVIISAVISQQEARNGGEAIARIARAEYANSAMNIGGTKYKDWYGMNADWCGMFVSWCADQAGVLDSTVPRTASVNNAVSWFMDRDEYKSSESGYEPKTGDIIFFTNGMSHMGIVVDYDEETDRVETIEGNSGASGADPYHAGSRVTNNFYPRSTSTIGGYGTPSYPILNLTGDTNAEKIYNAFRDSGYSKESAAAVVGNLFQEAGTDGTGDINIHATEGNGEGIGMVQWSFGRKTAFLNYCEEQGQPWPDTGLEIQIGYMMLELESTQWIWTVIGREYGDEANITLDEFKRLTDIDLATKVFCAKFERCHLAHANLAYRQEMAHTVYESFE